MKDEKPNFYNLWLKVGNIEGTITEFTKKVDKCIDNHENRINCIEKNVDHMEGKATAIGAIAGTLTSIGIALLAMFKKDIFGQ